MATPPKPISPPQEAFFDDTGGISKAWQWFLYQIFTTAILAFDLSVFEAFNRDDNPESSAALEAIALSAVSGDGLQASQIEELRALFQFTPHVGATQREIDEVLARVESSSESSFLPRLIDLERLVAMLAEPTPTPAAPLPFTNAAGAGGGVANNSSGIPTAGQFVFPGVTQVAVLPAAADPLSFIGNMVIYRNRPYIFTAGLAGPPGFWKIAVVSSTTIFDTRANRGGYAAAGYPVGTLYYETDTTLSYAVQAPAGVLTWLYYNGVWEDVLANLPGGLGVNDINLTFRASDYLHSWVWNGSAWHFGAGEQGFYPAGSYGIFNPGQVPFGLWHVCDGGTYAVAQDNATTSNVVTPTVANQYLRR